MKKVYGFLDFEFTIHPDDKPQEILSIGCVFADEKGHVVGQYSTIVRPKRVRKLSKLCTKVLGITQQMVEASPSFRTAMNELYSLYNKYTPKKCFVWGNTDKYVLRQSMRYCNVSQPIWDVVNHFVNFQMVVKGKIPYKKTTPADMLSLTNACWLYNLNYSHNYNALEDAIGLKKLYYAYIHRSYNINRLIIFNEFYKHKTNIIYYNNYQNLLDSLTQRLETTSNRLQDLNTILQVSTPVEASKLLEDRDALVAQYMEYQERLSKVQQDLSTLSATIKTSIDFVERYKGVIDE